jgi:hypothetical protein
MSPALTHSYSHSHPHSHSFICLFVCCFRHALARLGFHSSHFAVTAEIMPHVRVVAYHTRICLLMSYLVLYNLLVLWSSLSVEFGLASESTVYEPNMLWAGGSFLQLLPSFHCIQSLILSFAPYLGAQLQSHYIRMSSGDESIWGFSLRHSFYDSDDDSNTELSPENVVAGDEKLLRDLDLAARPDEAKFRANPWSIAKVNAASKPTIGNSEKQSHVSREGGATRVNGAKLKESGVALRSGATAKKKKGALANAFDRQRTSTGKRKVEDLASSAFKGKRSSPASTRQSPHTFMSSSANRDTISDLAQEARKRRMQAINDALAVDQGSPTTRASKITSTANVHHPSPPSNEPAITAFTPPPTTAPSSSLLPHIIDRLSAPLDPSTPSNHNPSLPEHLISDISSYTRPPINAPDQLALSSSATIPSKIDPLSHTLSHSFLPNPSTHRLSLPDPVSASAASPHRGVVRLQLPPHQAIYITTSRHDSDHYEHSINYTAGKKRSSIVNLVICLMTS